MRRQRERPVRRTNPSGERVWLARYTNSRGQRKSAGTFHLKRDAQAAIDAAYELPAVLDTVETYFETWTVRHPRSPRTNATNEHRISRVLDVVLDGRPLREWRIADLRRRHTAALIDVLLVDQRRSAVGARHIISALSAMVEDAITDELANANPFKGMPIRASDPRINKFPRTVRVFGFAEMHRFAAAAATAQAADASPRLRRWRARYAETMIRTFADCGLRLGEVLALEQSHVDFDDAMIAVRQTAHRGHIQAGTKTDHGAAAPGRLVPAPPTLLAMIAQLVEGSDGRWLFPTIRGRVWAERNFYRDVWRPTQLATGLDVRPHEMRHSWETHLLAAGVNPADLAAIAGHTMETMYRHYTHSIGASHALLRTTIG